MYEYGPRDWLENRRKRGSSLRSIQSKRVGRGEGVTVCFESSWADCRDPVGCRMRTPTPLSSAALRRWSAHPPTLPLPVPLALWKGPQDLLRLALEPNTPCILVSACPLRESEAGTKSRAKASTKPRTKSRTKYNVGLVEARVSECPRASTPGDWEGGWMYLSRDKRDPRLVPFLRDRASPGRQAAPRPPWALPTSRVSPHLLPGRRAPNAVPALSPPLPSATWLTRCPCAGPSCPTGEAVLPPTGNLTHARTHESGSRWRRRRLQSLLLLKSPPACTPATAQEDSALADSAAWPRRRGLES